MADFDVKSLLPDIKDILAHSDLNSVSAKAVRRQLSERHPDLDVKTHKAAIDELTLQCFSAQDTVQAEEAEDEKPSVKAETNGHSAKHASVPASSPPQPLATTSKPSTFMSAITSSAIPAPPKKQETDEEMARRLQEEFNGAGTRRTRGGGAAPAKKTKRKKKSASEAESGDDGPKKKRKVSQTGFNKPWALSDELADVCGTAVLSRPQVTKKIWEYIKANNLQDPKKKVDIITDDKLKRLFNNQNKVSSFGMAKFIGKHLYELDPADIPAEIKSQDYIDSEDEED